jgi:pimeloyl-ACP methyl ester carboxylesterase
VIAPGQVGFCKSTKPERYQYSFQALAENTHALLASLGGKNAVVIGHSTGGMLAAHYALMDPEETSALVLVNPIGLEDWKALGVSPPTVDQWLKARERCHCPAVVDCLAPDFSTLCGSINSTSESPHLRASKRVDPVPGTLAPDRLRSDAVLWRSPGLEHRLNIATSGNQLVRPAPRIILLRFRPRVCMDSILDARLRTL